MIIFINKLRLKFYTIIYKKEIEGWITKKYYMYVKKKKLNENYKIYEGLKLKILTNRLQLEKVFVNFLRIYKED